MGYVGEPPMFENPPRSRISPRLENSPRLGSGGGWVPWRGGGRGSGGPGGGQVLYKSRSSWDLQSV